MEYYKLRVDLANLTFDEFIDFLRKYTEVFAYCYEGVDTKNPHVHCYIETNIKQATLRSNLRKLGLCGNGSYSLKSVDSQFPIEYLAYMTKQGKYDISQLPEEVQSRAKALDAKIKAEIKRKREERKPILERLYEIVEKEGIVGPDLFSSQEVKLAILRYHKKNDILVRKFQLKAYYETIRLRYVSLEENLDLFD